VWNDSLNFRQSIKDISKTATGYYCSKISKTGRKHQKLLKFRHWGETHVKYTAWFKKALIYCEK